MSVTIIGLPKVLKNLNDYSVKVLQACVDAAQISQARIVNSARSNHPYKDRTGNLTNSIQPGNVEVSEEGITAYVEARMSYASFVEFGTSRAKAYPFLTPAMIAEYPNYRKTMTKLIGKIKL